MSRRRYQRGSVRLKRGTDGVSRWTGRWLEPDGNKGRVHRSRMLGVESSSDARRLGVPHVPTKRTALRLIEPFVTAVNHNTFEAPGPCSTFENFTDGWMVNVMATMKPSTQQDMRSQIRAHLMPAFGLMPLTKITPEVVQRFIAERSELSPKRIKNLLVTLGLIWKAARASGYVRTDVLQALRLPESRRPKRRFFTADECRKLFSFAEEPYKTMFWLDASTGLRAGELFGLRVEDIDLDAGMLRVEQSIWKREVNSTKTQAGERSFPIGPSLVRHLREFLTVHYRQNDLGLLFAAPDGRPFDIDHVVAVVLKPLCRRLGIEPAGLNALRHGQATLLDQVNAPMKIRQKRMGHTDARITLGVYTHTAPIDERRVADEIDALLSPNVAPILRSESTAAAQAVVN